MHRRPLSCHGQVAIEYISVYGFAFLTLMIALGVINYFGFFNPSSLKSQSCSLPRGLACNDYIVNTATPPIVSGTSPANSPYLRLNVTNEYGVNITVTSITRFTKDGITSESCSANLPASPWASGQTRIFWCYIPLAEYITDSFNDGSVTVNFTQAPSGTYSHSVTGRYSVKAQ